MEGVGTTRQLLKLLRLMQTGVDVTSDGQSSLKEDACPLQQLPMDIVVAEKGDVTKSPTELLVGMRGARTSTVLTNLMGICSKEPMDAATELPVTFPGVSLHYAPLDGESCLLMDDVDARLGAAHVGGGCHEGRHVLASHAELSFIKISWCRILSRYTDLNFMECDDRSRRITVHSADRLQPKLSLRALKVRKERRFIPPWSLERELDDLDKVAKMLQRLEARSDPDRMLLYHHTFVKSARSTLREELAPFHCKRYACGIFLGLLAAVFGWPRPHWEGFVQVKDLGRGCKLVAAFDDLAVVIVGLPAMMILACGAWFYPKIEGICYCGHQLQRLDCNKLQSHKHGVAQLTWWVSLIWCLTGVRFHTITIAEHEACDKPDFVDWLRNHLHEKFRLSYYTTRLMVDFTGSEGECLISGTWAELQRPSQIYVHQAVPEDFQEYRDLLHSNETSNLELALWAGQDPNCVNERGQTAAWRASRNGDLEKLRCLHKANADFDITDKRGASPLFAASDKGNVAVVRFLLDCGARVNLQGGPDHGTHAVVTFASPLYAGCQNCNDEIVQLLLDARADVNERTGDGATALMVAAQNGPENLCSRVLAACETTTISLEDPNGLTALYFAAQNGHAVIVGMLLKAGASTEVRSQDGATPLFKAAQNGHQEAVVPLLQHRADVFAAAHDGTTPLILAAYNGHVDVVDVLVPEIINMAGVKGLNIGMRSSGATAMFVAAQAGKDGVVRKLGLYGADAQKSLSSGAGPIHIAAQLGHLKVLKELLDAKADVEARGPDGITALYLASAGDHLKSVKHLLEQRADPDTCLDSGHRQREEAFNQAASELEGSWL
ncbi:ANK2 [Symbiodinium sp. CCMP2592]|nr:ANK2 [Symbiodinium sp. CCMP2592]